MQYKEILENISDWLWAVDTSGKYTYCSQNVFDFLGYTAEEVIGKTPFDFMPKREAKRIREGFAKIVEKREPFYSFKNTKIHKNGIVRSMNLLEFVLIFSIEKLKCYKLVHCCKNRSLILESENSAKCG